MSDGPYRSLPMSRGWKRLAEYAENANFDSADTCAAASHALETTWRNEVPAVVVNGLRDVFLDREPGLFPDARLAKIDAVAVAAAGYGLGRQLAAHASSVLAEGLTGEAGLAEATKRALDAYAARAARQIEEHYCRKASTKLTQQVRNRISSAIGAADFDTLARQCSGLEPRAMRRGGVRKHVDIDDGVPLS
ncbi:MAG TPA: hypothetical protein PK306_16405 [Aquabacterium sp.]|nr:hypothetical protein [Aquabacterium sp.]